MCVDSTYHTLLENIQLRTKKECIDAEDFGNYSPLPIVPLLVATLLMYLLTKWEDRTGKYLAPGQDVRPRAKYFPVRPARPHSVSLFLYVSVSHQIACIVICRAVRVSSRALRVFPALSKLTALIRGLFPWFSKEIARGAVRVT